MLWRVAVVALAVALSTLEAVQAERVLFLAPISTMSHKNFYMGIVNALADNNHQVTMVSPFRPPTVKNNVREVVLLDLLFTNHLPNMFTWNKLKGPMAVLRTTPRLCSDALEKEEMQALLEEEFDVVLLSVFFSDCFLSVVHKLKVPLIYVSPAGMVGPVTSVFGNPNFLSYITLPIFEISLPLTFLQRTVNTLVNIATDISFNHYLIPSMETECRKRGLCPDDMPSLMEMRLNHSLLLVNGVRTTEYPPRSVIPSMVYCGGIHCRPSKPLPQDLEEWVQDAGEAGFIFISLGTAVKASIMPEEYRTTLIEVFASLKQRVLWKWEEDTMEDLPPNVRLGKWLPQQDILGDPRLRLFISHGGLLSTQEAAYHGVPILGMPVFGDQHSNLYAIEREGWGRVALWEKLSPGSFKDTINDIIANKSLWTKAQEKSWVMRDQPQDPAAVASYWVEYVIRHNGARHLFFPSVDMPWYQLYNVDVWTFLAFVLPLLALIYVRVLFSLCSWLYFSKLKPKVD